MLILLKWDLYGIRPVFRQAKLPSYPSNINIMQTPNTTYKNTEIGSIPVDWEVKTLGDICFPSKTRINPITTTKNFKCIELEHLSQGSGILLGYAQTKNLLSQKSGSI